jgi:glycosidase
MQRLRILHGWGLLFGATITTITTIGCGGVEPPRRECTTVIWAEAGSGSDIRVEGSWNGWGESEALEKREDGWFIRPLTLAPGEYGYRIIRDGKREIDPLNALTTFHGEEEVSLAIVEDCSVPKLRIDRVDARDGEVTIEGVFLASTEGPPFDSRSLRADLPGGISVIPRSASAADGSFAVVASGLSRGKHSFTLRAEDESGKQALPALAVAWVDPAQEAWGEGILYHLMIDRFRGDGGMTLSPPPTPGSRAGGTLDGVRAEIEKGTFDALGVGAIWISPVYTNPTEIREGRDGRLYESYHGYWPLESRGVEPRIGGEAALRELMAEAHRHGIRIIFDLVPNHVYERNERYKANRNAGWFNDGPDGCICGNPGCGWGEKLGTCWFSPYMPDVRFQHAEAMRAQIDDSLYWMNEFDADGVRIDAVPMMPRAATRRITNVLRKNVAGKEATFSLGEVYTGAGTGGIESIRYYLGEHGLSSAFDFPLMWTIRDVFAADRQGFSALEDTLITNDAALAGSGSMLGRMIDNHDTSRFISEAVGNAGNDPWNAPPAQPTDPAVYARAKMALAFILTLPGLPVLYQGDELAMAGAGDPDSRRVMPDESAITPLQDGVRAVVQRLGRLRRCSAALRKGERLPIVVGPDVYAYARDAGDGDPALVIFARKSTAVPIPAGAAPAGQYVDVFSGETFDIGPNGGSIALGDLSFRVLLPSGSACHNPSP